MYRRSLKAYCDTIDQHIAQIRSIQKTHHVDQSFVILQNRACVVLEICESYDNTFVADPRIPLDRDHQLQQRLSYPFKDILFVGTMSSLEFYLRGFLETHHAEDILASLVGRKAKHPRDIPFSSTISKLQELNFITEGDLWTFALQLRNDIVHNDSVGRKHLPSPSSIDPPIYMNPEQEALGTLRSFVSLTQSIESSYFEAIKALL